MLWVLKKRLNGSFEHGQPKHMLKVMGMKILTILPEFFLLSKHVKRYKSLNHQQQVKFSSSAIIAEQNKNNVAHRIENNYRIL